MTDLVVLECSADHHKQHISPDSVYAKETMNAIDEIVWLRDKVKELENKYEEEKIRSGIAKNVIDRIWYMFGRPNYKDLNGKSIYCLISELQRKVVYLENQLKGD